jgi:hypothetical protein
MTWGSISDSSPLVKSWLSSVPTSKVGKMDQKIVLGAQDVLKELSVTR